MFFDLNLKNEIVRQYNLGNIKKAIDMCVNLLRNKNGEVNVSYYRLLLDLYQIDQNYINFVKIRNIYFDQFGVYLQDWRNNKQEKFTNQNFFLFKGEIQPKTIEALNLSYQKCQESRLGRVNFTQIDLMQSSLEGIKRLLQLLYECRQQQIHLILMGDNKILQWDIAQYDTILQETEQPSEILVQKIQELKQTAYLIQLEILQRKKMKEEYTQKGLMYFQLFQQLPPKFNDNWQPYIDNDFPFYIHSYDNNHDVLVLNVKHIDVQNLHYITHYLNTHKDFLLYIDFSRVVSMNYEAAQNLLFFIQSFRASQAFNIFIINANEMIKTIMEMVQLQDFFHFLEKSSFNSYDVKK